MQRPDFKYERQAWEKFEIVAGADEVGRGAWAGPVVAAAVAFAKFPVSSFQIPKGIQINDSKLLSPSEREKADVWIRKNAQGFGIGEASVSLVNRLGLTKASRVAFRRAIAVCNKKLRSKSRDPIQFLLVDAFYLPNTRGLRCDRQLAIIKGDQKSFSIAAASIIAKVYRDRLMDKLGKHEKYSWDKNKGYVTKAHQVAVLQHGITRQHRKQFVKKVLGDAQF